MLNQNLVTAQWGLLSVFGVVVALLAVVLSGCSCLPLVAMTAIGAAGTAVTHDPGHVLQPGVECLACLAQVARGRLPAP